MANSAKTLIDQYTHWQKPHLADEMKNLLIWAARLLEVGIVINHRNVQKHSAYILQNMELPGFDREQQRLLVNLVRYHTGAFKRMIYRFLLVMRMKMSLLYCFFYVFR